MSTFITIPATAVLAAMLAALSLNAANAGERSGRSETVWPDLPAAAATPGGSAAAPYRLLVPVVPWHVSVSIGSSEPSSSLDDEVRHDDERNQILQAASDAIVAASQASAAAQAAADQQMQNDLIRANEPLQQN